MNERTARPFAIHIRKSINGSRASSKTCFHRKENHEVLTAEACKVEAHGQYAEAAENYARAGAVYLDENLLIYARYCHDHVKSWIKAKEPGKAVNQAQEIFHVLFDTELLKRSMEQVLMLKQIIDEFNEANFTEEARTFASLLNTKLAELGLMLKPSGTQHPSQCPPCGAQPPRTESGKETTCSFCGYIVQAD